MFVYAPKMNRGRGSGYDICRENVFVIREKRGAQEQNSVRGRSTSSREIDGIEESMGATLTWS